ncbi:MAG TPA: universal stress protein [Streptosporangiaceae bacterium]|nr:universal stress protein [Streptosporangiaceae bacterium]
MNTTPGHRIVAGVDGSPSSMSGLQWAVEQARLTASKVDAVIAWHYPAVTGGFGMAPIVMFDDFDFAEAAEKVLAAAVAEAVPDAADAVRQLVVEGNPAQVLLDAAEGADLLVVGSRGHGGFGGTMLGSVGQHCVYHAHCPVLVMRH